MRRIYTLFAIQTLILLFFQSVALNHIRLFGYFMPILYLYPLFKLPVRTPRWITILLSGIVGFVLDLIMNTPGLNFASATLVGLVRTPILLSLTNDELLEEEGLIIIPSFQTLSGGRYILYFLSMTFIQISTLMLLEAFSYNIYAHVILNIIGSTLISFIIFLLFETFIGKKRI